MSARVLIPVVFIVLIVWAALTVRSVNGQPMPTTPTMDEAAPVPSTTASPADAFVMPGVDVLTRVKVKALQHKLTTEHRRYLQAHRRVRQLTRTLAHRSSTREAIDLACSIYGSCSTLWRRATCESGGYRFAQNPSGASGLFQFLPSTWATTPFGAFSIWSPYAQALAAGWMQVHGRGGEWVCQ